MEYFTMKTPATRQSVKSQDMWKKIEEYNRIAGVEHILNTRKNGEYYIAQRWL